jgi:hypothetical protein
MSGRSKNSKKSTDSVDVVNLAKLVRIYNQKSFEEIEKLPPAEVSQIRDAISTILEKLSPEERQRLPEETIVGIRKALNPYGPTIKDMEGKWLTLSITQLDKEFQQKLLMTSMVGFLFSKLNMWKHPKDMPLIDCIDFCNNPNILRELYADRAAEDPEFKETIEEYEKVMRKKLIIIEFLESVFQFNPNVHIEPTYKPNFDDTSRDIVMTPAAAMAMAFHASGNKKEGKDKFRNELLRFHRFFEVLPMLVKSTEKKEDTVFSPQPAIQTLKSHKYNLKDEGDSLKLTVGTLMKRSLSRKWTKYDDDTLVTTAYNIIHPANVYADLNMYTKNNYEKLVKITENLHYDKKDIDLAINPYCVHDSQEKAIEWAKKHRNNVIADIKFIRMGAWNMLFTPGTPMLYNEHSSALDEILHHQELSAHLGQAMMKKSMAASREERARKGKAPDEDTSKWIKAHGHKMGVDATDDQADFEECPDDKVEVLIHNIQAGGLKTSKAKVFIDTEPLSDKITGGTVDMSLGQPMVKPADEEVKPARSSIMYPPGTTPESSAK